MEVFNAIVKHFFYLSKILSWKAEKWIQTNLRTVKANIKKGVLWACLTEEVYKMNELLSSSQNSDGMEPSGTESPSNDVEGVEI